MKKIITQRVKVIGNMPVTNIVILSCGHIVNAGITETEVDCDFCAQMMAYQHCYPKYPLFETEEVAYEKDQA